MLGNHDAGDLPCLIQADFNGESLETGHLNAGHLPGLVGGFGLRFLCLGRAGREGRFDRCVSLGGFLCLMFKAVGSGSHAKSRVERIAGQRGAGHRVDFGFGDGFPDQRCKCFLCQERGTQSGGFLMLRNRD